MIQLSKNMNRWINCQKRIKTSKLNQNIAPALAENKSKLPQLTSILPINSPHLTNLPRPVKELS